MSDAAVRAPWRPARRCLRDRSDGAPRQRLTPTPSEPLMCEGPSGRSRVSAVPSAPTAQKTDRHVHRLARDRRAVRATGPGRAHRHRRTPPQQPGVTLRVFDVQVPLDDLCTLKAGQTPNIDKLMPVIDWSSPTDFGLESNFVTHVVGNLKAPQAGSYTFRLTSDDGSRLWIDDQVVIDHDGLHGPEPKDATVNLTAGHHTLRIEHFERGGGEQLTLAWKPPGAAGLTVVPNSALSTDADVVRVTAPGRKECEAGTDSPGDGLPLAGVHPNYTLTDLRPAGFEPQVSAMDWLPDGRLAVTTWGGSNNAAGEVYLLGNVTGATGPGRVTVKRIASGLKEPMGIKHVDGKLYVSQKHELTELNDTNGDEVTDQYRRVATWPFGGNFHEFAFGLLHQDGYFYLNLSVSINYGGATTDPQPHGEPRDDHQGEQADRRGLVRRRWPADPQRHRLGSRGRHLRHRQPGWLASLLEARAHQAGPVLQPPHQSGRALRLPAGDQAGAVAPAERDSQLAQHTRPVDHRTVRGADAVR